MTLLGRVTVDVISSKEVMLEQGRSKPNMIDVLGKRRNLEIGWGLGEPCRHQGIDQDDLYVNQGTTAKIARKSLEMKRRQYLFPSRRS